MRLPRPVVFDACVLVNYSLADLLLRLAEEHSLYDPKWSADIMQETVRTLESKLGWPASLISYFQAELQTNFAESWITGYNQLLLQMTNDDKDRHVVAAAVQAGAKTIVTFNLRHFRAEHLHSWGVVAVHPQEFLIEIFREDPDAVLCTLREKAYRGKRTLTEMLKILHKSVPDFARAVSKYSANLE